MEFKYQVKVGDCITSSSSSYRVDKILGSGSYGKVTECHKANNNQTVALKVLTGFWDDDVGTRESRILQILKERGSKGHHIVEYVDSFQYKGHHCHEFEKLDISLRQFLGRCPNRRLQLKEIRPIVTQMANALKFLKAQGVIHCDLKPDNIMMINHVQQPLRMKLIDFGLACLRNEVKPGTFMQSFHYRAPEVQVGGHITEAIDMWSTGCITAEMFLGKRLFCASSVEDLMRHLVEIVGQPPKYILDSGRRTHQFFRRHTGCDDWYYAWRFQGQPNPLTVRSLDDIYAKNPCANAAEKFDCNMFVDLLKCMLTTDPASRITPEDVLNHPFITMTHLRHYCPSYYSESKIIMDQVINFPNYMQQSAPSFCTLVSEASLATNGQTSQKRSRDVDKKEHEKRLTEEATTLYSRKRSREEGDEFPQKRMRRKHDSSEKSHKVEDDQRMQLSEATVATNGQKPSRKRKTEEEETRKRMRKDDHTCPRGHDEKRLTEKASTLQNTSREETKHQNRSREEKKSLQLCKEKGSPSKLPLINNGEQKQQLNFAVWTQFSDVTGPTFSQKSTQKRFQEDKEKMPQKSMMKEDISSKSQRGIFWKKSFGEAMILQKGNREDTKLSQLSGENGSTKTLLQNNDGKKQQFAFPLLTQFIEASVATRVQQPAQKKCKEEEKNLPQKKMATILQKGNREETKLSQLSGENGSTKTLPRNNDGKKQQFAFPLLTQFIEASAATRVQQPAQKKCKELEENLAQKKTSSNENVIQKLRHLLKKPSQKRGEKTGHKTE